jgi:hypothetical protein
MKRDQSGIYLLAITILGGLLGWAVFDGRSVTAEFAGLSFAISAPPEIEGEFTETTQGWLVRGRAVIRATTPQGTIREIVVPHGATRRVVLREGAEGMSLEIEK